MIVERILENFQKLTLEEKIAELQKFNELKAKGYFEIGDNILKLMETIINNELVDKEIVCENGICEIRNISKIDENKTKSSENSIEFSSDVNDKVDDLLFKKLIYFALNPFFSNLNEIFGVVFNDKNDETIGEMFSDKVFSAFKSLYNEYLFSKKTKRYHDIIFSPFHIENNETVLNEINDAFIYKLKNVFDDVYNGEVEFNKLIKFKIQKRVYDRLIKIFDEFDIEYDNFNINTRLVDLLRIPFFAILFGMILYYATKKRKLSDINNLNVGVDIYKNAKLNEKFKQIKALKRLIQIYDRIFSIIMSEKDDILSYIKEHFSESIEAINDLHKKIDEFSNDFGISDKFVLKLNRLTDDIISSNIDIDFNDYLIELKKRFYEDEFTTDEEKEFEKILSQSNKLRLYYEYMMQKHYLVEVFNERFDRIFESDSMFKSIINFKLNLQELVNIIESCKKIKCESCDDNKCILLTGIDDSLITEFLNKMNEFLNKLDDYLNNTNTHSIFQLYYYINNLEKNNVIFKSFNKDMNAFITKNQNFGIYNKNELKIMVKNDGWQYIFEVNNKGAKKLNKYTIEDLMKIYLNKFNTDIKEIKYSDILGLFFKLYKYKLNQLKDGCDKKLSVDCMKERGDIIEELINKDDIKTIIEGYNKTFPDDKIEYSEDIENKWEIVKNSVKSILIGSISNPLAGEGPYERLIQILYPEVKISGGSTSFDVFYLGKPYEVKKMGGNVIRLGREGFINRFPNLYLFLTIIYDILNILDNKYVVAKLSELVLKLGDENSEKFIEKINEIIDILNKSASEQASKKMKTQIFEKELKNKALEVFKELLNDENLGYIIEELRKLLNFENKYVSMTGKAIEMSCENEKCECRIIDNNEYETLKELDLMLMKLLNLIGDRKLLDTFNKFVEDVEGFLSTSFKRHPIIVWSGKENSAILLKYRDGDDGFMRNIKFDGISQGGIVISSNTDTLIDQVPIIDIKKLR
jgi:hypothetical protein